MQSEFTFIEMETEKTSTTAKTQVAPRRGKKAKRVRKRVRKGRRAIEQAESVPEEIVKSREEEASNLLQGGLWLLFAFITSMSLLFLIYMIYARSCLSDAIVI